MTAQKTPTALGTESIGKLLMQYAVPAIIAMTASSLYNMVDSIFIGHGVGTMALSALALTFPLMNLGAAFGALVGVGAATLISVKLGQKDYDTAQRVLGNVFVLNILLGLAFTVIVFPFLNPILYFFGGSDETVEYARQFMEIILLGNVVTHLYLGLNAVLRASGHPKQAMYATIATVAINTILAPIFIFMFDWGIRGAAIATVSAQVIALLWQLKQFNNANELLHFRRGIFRLKRKIVFDSLAIGMSPFLMNLAACLIVILINQGLKKYGGDLAIGAFGILNRIQMLFVMIVMGITMGMQPISGYNYGAGNIDRVKRTLKLGIVAATCITTFGFLISELFPGLFVGMFTNNEELTHQATIALQIGVAVFPIIGSQIIITQFFQSIGKAAISIFLSLSRQLLFLLPGLALLPPIYGVKGVWFSMPISDFLAALAAIGMRLYQLRKMKLENLRGV